MEIVIKNQIAQAIETGIETKKPINHKFYGTFRPKIDGGKIFRYCKTKKTIEVVELQYKEDFSLIGPNKKRLILDKNSAYVEALNLKNAIKKFSKGKIIFIS